MGIYLHFYNRVGAKLTAILWLLTVRTGFFVCLNYPTFGHYNQPCIAFIYSLFIFLLPLYGKRAPAIIGRGSFPRSRTGCDIFSFGSHTGCDSAGHWVHRFNLIPPHELLSMYFLWLSFNLTQSRRLRLVGLRWCDIDWEFQSYAVTQTATAISHSGYILYML